MYNITEWDFTLINNNLTPKHAGWLTNNFTSSVNDGLSLSIYILNPQRQVHNKATLLHHQYLQPAILFYKLPLQIEDYGMD